MRDWKGLLLKQAIDDFVHTASDGLRKVQSAEEVRLFADRKCKIGRVATVFLRLRCYSDAPAGALRETGIRSHTHQSRKLSELLSLRNICLEHAAQVGQLLQLCTVVLLNPKPLQDRQLASSGTTSTCVTLLSTQAGKVDQALTHTAAPAATVQACFFQEHFTAFAEVLLSGKSTSQQVLAIHQGTCEHDGMCTALQAYHSTHSVLLRRIVVSYWLPCVQRLLPPGCTGYQMQYSRMTFTASLLQPLRHLCCRRLACEPIYNSTLIHCGAAHAIAQYHESKLAAPCGCILSQTLMMCVPYILGHAKCFISHMPAGTWLLCCQLLDRILHMVRQSSHLHHPTWQYST